MFLAVMLLIVAGFYCANLLFWNNLNFKRNEQTIISTYEKLSEMVKEGKTTVQDMEEIISAVKDGSNLKFALQGDTDWGFIAVTRELNSPYERQFLLSRLQANFIVSENMDTESQVEVISETANYTLQKVKLSGDGSRYLECYGYMTDADGASKKFILSMPLEGFFDLSDTSNSFFIYMSIALLVVGGILIFILTYQITKPIVQLSIIARRMSRLDFSARYTGNQQDEIGILGNSMNDMSGELEKTIEELKKANESLQKDLDEKNRLDEMRKDFISNVSHELKTPIALIQGYAEGLQEMGDDPETKEYYTGVIIDEADKMNRMVKKLTTLNQLEFGQDIIEEEPFDIMDMLRGITIGARKLAEEKNAVLSVEGPESMMVIGDEFRIEEVCNNYISNAFNHLKEPGLITISAKSTGDIARISVRNTGDCIPEEELENIWIKFHKVDKARTREYGGSGIGLSIVKAVMEAHHMGYGVYNTEDGVVFWFELKRGTAWEE